MDSRLPISLLLALITGLGVAGCSRGTDWSSLSANESQRVHRVALGNDLNPDLTGVWSTEDGKHISVMSLNGLVAHSDDGGGHWKEDLFESSLGRNTVLVGCCDHNHLWSLGTNGEVDFSEDGGSTWKIASAATERNLNSLSVTRDGSDLWAVGDKGTIVHSSDGGHNWSTQASPTEKILNGVWSSPNGDRLWAVGSGGVVLHSEDRGRTWELLPKQSVGSGDFSTIVGEPNGQGLWIALSREITSPGESRTHLLHSSDGGKTWKPFEQPGIMLPSTLFPSGMSANLIGIATPDVGDSGSQILIYDAPSKEWRVVFSSDDLWIRGLWSSGDGQRLWAVGDDGVIMKSSNGGVTWANVRLGLHGKGDLFSNSSNTAISSVSTSDGREFYSVADNGVFHSTDGGRTWSRQDLSALSDAKFTEWTVGPTLVWATPDLRKVWIGTDTGLVLHIDKSASGIWTDQITERDAGLKAMTGTSDGQELWCVTKNGVVFHSVDAGQHWKSQFEKADAAFSAVWSASGGRQLWVAGDDGLVLYSIDRGEHWQQQNSRTEERLTAIWGASGHLWIAGAKGTIISSNDSGFHWTLQDTPTSSDLFAIWGNQNTHSIFALGSGEPASNTGVLLESLDEGRPWIKQQINFPVYSGGGLQWFDQQHVASFWTGSSSPDTFRINTLTGLAPSVSQYRFVSVPGKIYVDIRLFGLEAGDSSKIGGILYGSNEYSNSVGREDLITRSRIKDDSNAMSFSFDPVKALGVRNGEKLYSNVFVTLDGTGRDFDLPPYVYDQWGLFNRHAKLLTALAVPLFLLLLLCLSLLLKPILLYRIYSRARIFTIVDAIPSALGGDIIKATLKLTLVPVFATHVRTLDAWVSEKSESWRQQFKSETRLIGAGSYIALPVEILDDASTQFLKEPLMRDLSGYFRKDASFVQIVGPGGVGKTSLAIHIAELAFIPKGEGLFSWAALPVFLKDEITDLQESVRRAVEFYAKEELDQDFLRALVRKRRILLIVDRLSERALTSRNAIKDGAVALRPGTLVITTRTETALRSARGVTIRPLPLDSGTLLFFMTQLLKAFPENTAFSSIKDQIELAERLSRLLLLGDNRGEVPITPLLARLYIEKAVRLVGSQGTLDDLPSSIPDAYFDFLRDLNPKDVSVANRLTDEQMLRIAGSVAMVALKPDWVPKEISRLVARQAIQAANFQVQEGIDVLQRFLDNGVLIGSYAGPEEMVRFALDPVCECLGAFRFAEEAASDSSRRTEMEDRMNNKEVQESGFDLALRVTLVAYGTRFGWAGYSASREVNSSDINNGS